LLKINIYQSLRNRIPIKQNKAMKNSKVLLSAILFALVISCGEGPNAEKPAGINGTGGSLQNSSIAPGQAAVTGYSFDGSEGDPIALGTAQTWTSNYRGKNAGDTEAHFFGSAIIKQILAEAGCVGIRMYYAIDNNGQKQILLAGVNAKGEDILPASTQLDSSDPNIVADFSWPCPTYCGGGM
jgi:hypothetical protein